MSAQCVKVQSKESIGKTTFLDEEPELGSEMQRAEQGPGLICVVRTPHTDSHLMSGTRLKQ